MTQQAILAAEFTSKANRESAYLDINVIENGMRKHVSSHAVRDKRAARAMAKSLGATPWNF